MSLRINDEAPNFTAETTQGTINFHEWIGNGWADPVFSPQRLYAGVHHRTRLYGAVWNRNSTKRNTKIIGLSVDPVASHLQVGRRISKRPRAHKVTYPMIGDPELKVAKLYDMLPADAGTTSEGRTAANNATVRTVFVIGPDKKIKLMLIYPDEYRTKLRRSPARAGFDPTHGHPHCRHAGELEEGRGRDHSAFRDG